MSGFTLGLFVVSVDRKAKRSRKATSEASEASGESSESARQFFIAEGDHDGLAAIFRQMGLTAAQAKKSAKRAIDNA